MPPIPTPLYHITHRNNLVSIIADGGLLAHSRLAQSRRAYENIAYQHIQDRRASSNVPLAPGGNLHDYIPFYFGPRSPMLYTINRGNVAGIANQRPIIHLVVEAQALQRNNIPFVFTDGHAVMAFSEFFDHLENLDQVDWGIMQATYWHDTADDYDRKRRRQAEFLVHQFCPWELVTEIGVYDQETLDFVQATIAASTHQPIVRINRRWYY
jgi:hypothetical protein